MYYPAFTAVRLSFYQWDGFGPERWVGLRNFERLFTNSVMLSSINNMLILTVARILIVLTTPLLAAELVFHLMSDRWKYWYRVIFVIPLVVPDVVTYLIWQFIFNPSVGLANVFSFKDNSQFYSTFWGPALPLHWSNYADAWRQLYAVLINTIFVGTVSAFGTIFLASLSAYVFARHRFPGHDLLFYAIIALLMIPGVLTLIPLFLLVKDLGLLNTYWVLILPYIAGGQAFAIFVLRSFIASQPEEIFESARIDGANEFTIYQRIALPMAKPILGTLAILALLSTWNDYIWPSVTLRNPELWTIKRISHPVAKR